MLRNQPTSCALDALMKHPRWSDYVKLSRCQTLHCRDSQTYIDYNYPKVLVDAGDSWFDVVTAEENVAVVNAFAQSVQNIFSELCAIFEGVYVDTIGRIGRSEQHVRFDSDVYALEASLPRLFEPMTSVNGQIKGVDLVTSKLFLMCTLDVAQRVFKKHVVDQLKESNVVNAENAVPRAASEDHPLSPNAKDILRDEVVMSGWAIASLLKVSKREKARLLRRQQQTKPMSLDSGGDTTARTERLQVLDALISRLHGIRILGSDIEQDSSKGFILSSSSHTAKGGDDNAGCRFELPLYLTLYNKGGLAFMRKEFQPWVASLLILIRKHVTVKTLAAQSLAEAWSIICSNAELSLRFRDAYSTVFSAQILEDPRFEANIASDMQHLL